MNSRLILVLKPADDHQTSSHLWMENAISENMY